mmetsp:Transcript_2146/g.4499  ORF Transcript_2146/g.4499 Transcript_2146/m.4499 type:complete len:210 (+) Transcript_2146:1454-2083(+)
MMLTNCFVILIALGLVPDTGFAFQQSFSFVGGAGSRHQTHTLRMAKEDLLTVRSFIEEYYPSFHALIDQNDEAWKKMSDSMDGYTFFVPSENAFAELGEKKNEQLQDIRNQETIFKIGAYHLIPEVVTFDDLYNSGGVITLGGDIEVDRSKSGGMFGLGGQEDGGVVVSGARVTQTMEVGPGLVHETDGLACPSIMWRYMDQLRIPGSR